MSTSPDSSERPMAEPAAAPKGGDVGGMRANADGGLANATQRSMEKGDATTPTPTQARDEPASPASGPSASSRPTPPASDHNAAWDAADARDQERHLPVAPKDEGVLDSLGKSISEVVTGANTGTTKTPPGRS